MHFSAVSPRRLVVGISGASGVVYGVRLLQLLRQLDIESHAHIINAVLKLSTKLKHTCSDCNRFHESGLHLQNRWHCLWLRSLEWQCRLEQELARRHKAAPKVR